MNPYGEPFSNYRWRRLDDLELKSMARKKAVEEDKKKVIAQQRLKEIISEEETVKTYRLLRREEMKNKFGTGNFIVNELNYVIDNFLDDGYEITLEHSFEYYEDEDGDIDMSSHHEFKNLYYAIEMGDYIHRSFFVEKVEVKEVLPVKKLIVFGLGITLLAGAITYKVRG